MKFLVVVLGFFVALVGSLSDGEIKYDTLLIGKIDPISRLIHLEKSLAKPFTMKNGGIQILNWTYPSKDVENKYIISHILLFNYFLNWSSDPHAELLEGGPGHYNCTIRLVSSYQKGFNFTIFVYAYMEMESPQLLDPLNVLQHSPYWELP